MGNSESLFSVGVGLKVSVCVFACVLCICRNTSLIKLIRCIMLI